MEGLEGFIEQVEREECCDQCFQEIVFIEVYEGKAEFTCTNAHCGCFGEPVYYTLPH